MEVTDAPQLAYASWGRRILSDFIDYIVIYFISTPFIGDAGPRLRDTFTAGRTPEASDLARALVVTLIVIVSYTTLLHGWRGSTFGKMAARTVLVNDDGSKVTPQTAFVRAVSFGAILFSSFILVAPLIVNELRPLWSRERQTFHDRIARTVVVRSDSAAHLNET